MSRFSKQKDPCQWVSSNERKKYCSNEARVTDRKTGKRYCEFHAFLIEQGDSMDDEVEEQNFKKVEAVRKAAELADKQAKMKEKIEENKKKKGTKKKKFNPLAGEFSD